MSDTLFDAIGRVLPIGLVDMSHTTLFDAIGRVLPIGLVDVRHDII